MVKIHETKGQTAGGYLRCWLFEITLKVRMRNNRKNKFWD